MKRAKELRHSGDHKRQPNARVSKRAGNRTRSSGPRVARVAPVRLCAACCVVSDIRQSTLASVPLLQLSCCAVVQRCRAKARVLAVLRLKTVHVSLYTRTVGKDAH